MQGQATWDLQKFDYAAFRAAFVKGRETSSFQRTIERADAIKAQKWEGYKQYYQRVYGRPYVHAN